MNSGGGVVRADADKLADFRRRFDELYNEFWAFLAGGITIGSPTKPSNNGPFEADIDVSRIAWKRKDKTPASENDQWAWAFPTDRDGVVLEEAREIYEACQQYGEVKTGKNIVKLGGRDGNLLNRRLAK